MHIVIVALHYPERYSSQYERLRKNPSYGLYQYPGNFKDAKSQAVEGLITFLKDVINQYEKGAITELSLVTDFNLGYSTFLSTPIPYLNLVINSFTDKHNQHFKTQNNNTASSASTSAVEEAAASAAAPSFIPVNFYFEGNGSTSNPESGIPQYTVKEIIDEYGTGKGQVISFFAMSRPASRNSITNPNLSGTSPSIISSATTSPIPTPPRTIRKHSSTDAIAGNLPQLPSYLTALSSSSALHEVSESRRSISYGSPSLFSREVSESRTSISYGSPSLFPREVSESRTSMSCGSASHFLREVSSASSSSGCYEDSTPCFSATPESVSVAFLSPSSCRGEDDEILTAVAEATEATEAEEASTTPVNNNPAHSILSFSRDLHSKSPVESPMKIRPGLFGTRSSNNTPVSSLLKSDTPSPKRPALTVEINDVENKIELLNL